MPQPRNLTKDFAQESDLGFGHTCGVFLTSDDASNDHMGRDDRCSGLPPRNTL